MKKYAKSLPFNPDDKFLGLIDEMKQYGQNIKRWQFGNRKNGVIICKNLQTFCYNTGMKPVIKYQGGKTKELSRIKEFAPKEFKRIVEPFCGGSAVALHYGDTCVLNDINKAVINLYRQIGSDNYPTIQRRIDEIKTYDHDELEKVFYSSRDIINDPDDYSDLEYAIAYIVVRQLCFSGMERYNSEGKFNVPFGHYKKMSW